MNKPSNCVIPKSVISFFLFVFITILDLVQYCYNSLLSLWFSQYILVEVNEYCTPKLNSSNHLTYFFAVAHVGSVHDLPL